jgi:hypothetical protein
MLQDHGVNPKAVPASPSSIHGVDVHVMWARHPASTCHSAEVVGTLLLPGTREWDGLSPHAPINHSCPSFILSFAFDSGSIFNSTFSFVDYLFFIFLS